jgi:hypothetical protein
MKLKLAIAACVAALVVPATPAAADNTIPGTCYETKIPGGTTSYPCECLVGVPWVTVTPPRTVTITYCHVGDPIGNG